MHQTLRNMMVKLRRDRRGNVAVASALLLPVLLGAFGIGAEASSWAATKRAMQNAADAAAIAAATNASSSYATEAMAVTAQYGFQNGVNGVSVTASNTAACPASAGSGPCYGVTVSRAAPLLLAQITGYQGDTKVNGAPAKIVRASSIAVQGTTNRPYCLLALGASGADPALRTNGAPKANLSGCNVMSNTGATCNGHNLNADVGDAHKTNTGCGVIQNSNLPTVADPYASLASNIPADPCGGIYPQEPTKKSGTALPAKNTPSGAVAWSGVTVLCGDVQLAGNTTIGQNTTLVIYNGQLDTNGYTLQSAAGVGMTVVFAGTNGSYIHAPTGGGTLDFAAPTSGPWSGIAMYQAPDVEGSTSMPLNMGVDVSAAGNSPTWDITGVVYLPHSSVTFSGAVNKSSNGQSCFAMVVDNMTINGTGSILAHGQCGQAGVTMPTGQIPARGQLVG